MQYQSRCVFCGAREVISVTINSSSVVCAGCVNKTQLNLSTPAKSCYCRSQEDLIPVYCDGQVYIFCSHHLPVPVAVVLARQLTDMYAFNNAPSLYGSKSNFDLIKSIGQKNISELKSVVLAETVQLGKDLLVFSRVLRGMNKKSSNHLSHSY